LIVCSSLAFEIAKASRKNSAQYFKALGLYGWEVTDLKITTFDGEYHGMNLLLELLIS